MKLSQTSLSKLPKAVKRPAYDRSRLRPGILHIGVGNYHRAHQSWYLNRLFELGFDHDWAIVGAGVRDYDKVQRQKLQSQDWLTSLIERDANGVSVEIVGSMIDYVPISEGNVDLIVRMTDPHIRIVSLTVTEGGYFIDPSTNEFDLNNPDIIHDMINPDRPRTAFGAIVAALKIRRDTGIGPFTGLCCDNLQGNGAILRQTLVKLAQLSDPELATWIDESCSFPNSMVDGIVPATGQETLELAAGLGVVDSVPVAHEKYRHWVIEDDFCAGRPSLEQVDVIFSDRVHDYESMKIRVLNAGHQILANAGEILSLNTIADCMEHKELRAFFEKVEVEDILPHVSAVPHMSPTEYLQCVIARFENPEIQDTTRRVAFDGSSRHTGFVLPVIREALDQNSPMSGLVLTQALWARMCQGVREDGSSIANNDPLWDELTEVAEIARENPVAWLDQKKFYGNLSDNPNFAAKFDYWLRKIWNDGTKAALSDYLRED